MDTKKYTERLDLADLIIRSVIDWEPNLDSKTWKLIEEYREKYLAPVNHPLNP